jgi:hypothetical protein
VRGHWEETMDGTVQYFSDSAPAFLGLANGTVDRYFGPRLSPPTTF